MLTSKKLIVLVLGMSLSICLQSQVAPISPKVETESGDFYGPDSEYGVVLTSPNGTCYRIRIADDGTIFSEAISCEALIFPGAVQHSDGSPASECGCSEHTARLIGMLWADGSWNAGDVPPNGDGKPWFFRLKDDPDGANTLADHYELILQTHCIDYNRNTDAEADPNNPGQFLSDSFTFSLQETQGTNTQIDDSIWNLSGAELYSHPFIFCNPQAFMAAMIESEGNSGSGKVYDNPDAAKRQSIIDLLDLMGISVIKGNMQGVFSCLFLDQSVHPDNTWSNIFQDWPFFRWARVPGGGPAGNPNQTSEPACISH